MYMLSTGDCPAMFESPRIGHQVYPGVLALFREITNHRSNKQREKPPKDMAVIPKSAGRMAMAQWQVKLLEKNHGL